MKSAIQSFTNGDLTTNEYAVLTAIRARSENGRVEASTTKISDSLNGELSRHAVARALRNLEKGKWLSWDTTSGSRNSTIQVR